MPRKLEAFPPSASSVYPWAQLLDGGPWELVAGEDFAARPSTFIANARAQAKRKGGTIRTRTLVDNGGTRVIVQYLRRDDRAR